MADMKVGLVVELVNKTGAALKEITNNFSVMRAAAKTAERYFDWGMKLNQSSEAFSRFSDKAQHLIEKPVEDASDLQAALSQIGARSQASAGQMAAISDAALRIGTESEFNVTAVATALKSLMRPGADVNKVLGAMPQITAFASAGVTDLGTATSLVSHTMKAYGLTLDDVGTVTDTLTKAARLSGQPVAQLGESIAELGPVAHAMGLDFSQSTSMIGMMTRAGLSGERAMGAMRAVLLRLAAPRSVKESAAVLSSIGVSAYDAQRNLRSLPELLADIGEKTASMGSAERIRAFKTLFGSMAGGNVAAMFEGLGSGGVASYMTQMANVTGETKIAEKTIEATAKASKERLEASYTSLSATMGTALIPATTRWNNLLASVVGGTAKLASAAPITTFALMGTAKGAATLASAGSETLKTLSALSGAAGLVALATGGKHTAAELVGKLIPALNASKFAALGLKAGLIGAAAASTTWAVGQWVDVFKTARSIRDKKGEIQTQEKMNLERRTQAVLEGRMPADFTGGNQTAGALGSPMTEEEVRARVGSSKSAAPEQPMTGTLHIVVEGKDGAQATVKNIKTAAGMNLDINNGISVGAY